jgi:hypothetical protein
VNCAQDQPASSRPQPRTTRPSAPKTAISVT